MGCFAAMRCSQCGHELAAESRFCSQCGAPLATPAPRREERKVVTVLFADLVGFTSRAEQLDPEDVRALLFPYHTQLRTTLERFGGTVEKFIGDAVMALFGAPIAHEDDPERAVRAALAIRDWVLNEQRELQLRIGINTGEALISLDARPSEGEAMASGDVVNTASRLQSMAPVNGILVGEVTHRATSGVVRYRGAEPLVVKGKAEPVAAFEVVEARSRIARETPRGAAAAFVGRRREFRLLTDSLARVQEDRVAQLVTIVGVPGIGKSRLVAELFRAVEQQQDIVIWRQGRSLPYGEGVTFWALSEMVKAQASVLETDSLEQAEAKLHEAVTAVTPELHDAMWIESHLRPLLGLGVAQQARPEARAEAFTAWSRFMQRLAGLHPLVLVFDDVHWADDNLLDFIDTLVDAADDVPILVVCTARPEFFDRRPTWGGGKRNAATISLSPLSDSECAQLISELSGRHLMAAEAKQSVLSRAAGNPLFAEQYVRMLGERGDVAALTLPETVHGIIAARIDALSDAEKRTLQDAAVVGRVFWPGAVAAVGDTSPEDVDASLRSLHRKDFVQRAAHSSVAGEHEYSFLHALMRDVAYGQIPRGVRAEKHRRTGDWLAATARNEATAEMLAHHYLSAVQLRRAAGTEVDAELLARTATSLEDAGIRAQALAANREALRYFNAALDLTPGGTLNHGHLLLRIGRAQSAMGDAADTVLTEAAQELLACGSVEGAAEAEVELANVRWIGGDRAGADAHLERARQLVTDVPPSPTKAMVVTVASRLLMLASKSEEAIEVSGEALEMSRRFGLTELQSAALNNLGTTKANGGDVSGIADLEESVRLARAAHATFETARALNNLAVILMNRGDLTRSFELLTEIRELAARTGQEGFGRFNRACLVERLHLLGRWDEAIVLIDELAAEVEAGTQFYLAGQVYAVRGRIREARGAVELALADVERATLLAARAGDPQMLLTIWSEALVVWCDTGRLEPVADLFDRVLLLLREYGIHFYARTVHLLGWSAAVLAREPELLAVCRGVENAWARAAVAYMEGDLGAAAGMCEAMGARTEEAYDRMMYGDRLLRAGRVSDAEAQLQRALSFYRSVQAHSFIARCERLLSGTAGTVEA